MGRVNQQIKKNSYNNIENEKGLAELLLPHGINFDE